MKTVLITGGSRGIGRAMVELFSSKGYRVAFTYKNSENEAKSLAEATHSLAIKADSASEADVAYAVDTAGKYLGEIHCLINNAAISSFSLITDLSLEDWNETINTNLTGPFLYCRAVIGQMIRRKAGRIINISSMWGIVGASCEAHYSASKAGLIGLTKALAKELGPSGITVNAIAPGLIDTDINKNLSEDDINSLCRDTPVMRIGKPEEVASCAYYLAGEEASFITGEVINISGGFVI